MKRSQIVIALGAFTLAIGSFSITKASKQFNCVTCIKGRVYSANFTVPCAHWTTDNSTGAVTAFFKTLNGITRTMVTVVAGTPVKAYYH